ncbi:permease prefix domain 1-containing protein [Paenibacillus mendelii]|uniref:Permease prefix domain 1-containing protein n=1 Tax=Paenibacillus mendelii TaxID=206163 RepID=A0ABV6J447_9BACL|nr:permease prefix domain 1-containing protein [Paenibacillus mendelii]MCQ6561822.1 permease prefix domain 1-containing protein [Paenibacillus mendelii]
MTLLRKAFSLGDIRHSWLLILSVAICGVFFYMDRMDIPDDRLWLSIGYGVSFGIALLWSIVNYISHIRINVLYRNHSDIRAYVEQLAMSDEDKLELRNYLEDYTEDLMNQGKPREQAAAEAISQFKVKELLSLSKNTSLFQLHAHYYLFGWAAVASAAFILLVTMEGALLPNGGWVLILETIFIVYGAAFIVLFLVYKVLDVWIYQKVHGNLT